MDTVPPYVEAKVPIRGRARVRGEEHDVVVLGWRGERVYLRWRTDMGNHLGWVPAADVRRTGVAPSDVRR